MNVLTVHAVDVSAELVSTSALPPNFQFCLSSGVDIPLPDGSIDLAYSHDVIEHLHPDDAIDQCREVLRTLVPGGLYLCVTPNRLSGPHDISGNFDEVATGFHLKEYTVGELSCLLRSVGFTGVGLVLSYKGHRLSPKLPVLPFAMLEQLLMRLPRNIRRKLARPLTAAKVIGSK